MESGLGRSGNEHIHLSSQGPLRPGSSFETFPSTPQVKRERQVFSAAAVADSTDVAVGPCASGPPQNPLHASLDTTRSPRSRSLVKLPSIGEFDLGVERLARNEPLLSPWIPPGGPWSGKNHHINQKYSTEEGDFIIYAWHDKRMKWQSIKEEFAALFGRTPERTVQGLQGWYYRMNQKIPVWDHNGWLCFENEDDEEPKHISLKFRERGSRDAPTGPFGLAQRYPERAIRYSWVDMGLKSIAKSWGEHTHRVT